MDVEKLTTLNKIFLKKSLSYKNIFGTNLGQFDHMTTILSDHMKRISMPKIFELFIF